MFVGIGVGKGRLDLATRDGHRSHAANDPDGLAPFADDSGARRGARRIRGGRVAARCALYQAARSARRWNPPVRAFAGRGKAAKAVLVAVTRKLLVIVNAVLRENAAWSPRTA